MRAARKRPLWHDIAGVLGRPIRGPARNYTVAQALHTMRHGLNLTPISEVAEADIVVVGYPKSGNTWFQNLVAGAIFGVNPRYASDTLIQTLTPDVDNYLYFKRYGDRTYFKSHHLPKPQYRRVVYLLRDGRDAMVSYFHYLTTIHGEDFSFLEMVRDGTGLYPCKWHEHVGTWLSNPYDADMIVIKYEDLKTDPQQLRRFCEFVGVERDDDYLAAVYDNASFQNMRQNELKYGWDHRDWWPSDKFFVRRGKVGSYRDEMPEEALKLFMRESSTVLERCGYPVEEHVGAPSDRQALG